jgi:hypothetical protein
MQREIILSFTAASLLAAGISVANSQAPQSASPVPLSAGSKPQLPVGGSSTGPELPPMLDAEHRPITAGGFVKEGPVVFQDISQSSGLASWHHRMGNPQKDFILDSIGSGVALLDFDNDGWLDIYLVNGSTYEAMAGKADPPRAALFHNNHDGTFTDVAAKAGVTNDRWGYAATVGDYDNAGWPSPT